MIIFLLDIFLSKNAERELITPDMSEFIPSLSLLILLNVQRDILYKEVTSARNTENWRVSADFKVFHKLMRLNFLFYQHH